MKQLHCRHLCRRERRAIEAFEKRSSGGGGVGPIHCHHQSSQQDFSLSKFPSLFPPKHFYGFLRYFPLFYFFHHENFILSHVRCSRWGPFEAGSIWKGKQTKIIRFVIRLQRIGHVLWIFLSIGIFLDFFETTVDCCNTLSIVQSHSESCENYFKISSKILYVDTWQAYHIWCDLCFLHAAMAITIDIALCAIAFAKASSLCRRLLRKCGEQPIRCGLQKRRSPFIILSKGTLLVSLKESHEFSHFFDHKFLPLETVSRISLRCHRLQQLGSGWKRKKSVLQRELASSGGIFVFLILSMSCMLQMSCSEKALVCSSLWRTIEPWSPRLRMPGQHCKHL